VRATHAGARIRLLALGNGHCLEPVTGVRFAMCEEPTSLRPAADIRQGREITGSGVI
jgi:hypothetical protein